MNLARFRNEDTFLHDVLNHEQRFNQWNRIILIVKLARLISYKADQGILKMYPWPNLILLILVEVLTRRCPFVASDGHNMAPKRSVCLLAF